MMVEKSALPKLDSSFFEWWLISTTEFVVAEVEQLTAHPRATVEQLVTDYLTLSEMPTLCG